MTSLTCTCAYPVYVLVTFSLTGVRHFVTHLRKRIAKRLITELADVIVPGGRLLLLAVHVRLSTEARIERRHM